MNDSETNSTYARVQGDWEPRRYSVIGPDGQLWRECGDREEAVAAMRPGDRLLRTWERICRESQMREEQP